MERVVFGEKVTVHPASPAQAQSSANEGGDEVVGKQESLSKARPHQASRRWPPASAPRYPNPFARKTRVSRSRSRHEEDERMRLSTRLGQLCPAKHADATGLRTQATNPQVNTPCGQDAPRCVNPLARKTRPREPRPHHEEGERTCLSTRLGQLCPAKHADATGLLSQVTNPQVNTPCGQDAHSKTGNGCREAPPAVSKQRGSVATKGPPETAQRRAQRSATKRDEGPRRRNTGMDTPFPQKKAQRDALRLYVEKKIPTTGHRTAHSLIPM